jgi:hypothetical protein
MSGIAQMDAIMKTQFSRSVQLLSVLMSFRRSALGIVSMFLALWNQAGAAAEIRVPADRPTIQEAITNATAGDSIIVAPGIYFEAINFLGKEIVVASEAGPAVTILDASRSNTVVTIKGNVGRGAALRGFTVRNGLARSGGGIAISNGASPTIVGNIITNNSACEGPGVYISGSQPLLRDNFIVNNFVSLCTPGAGGGIYITAPPGAAEIIHNVITNNSAGLGLKYGRSNQRFGWTGAGAGWKQRWQQRG